MTVCRHCPHKIAEHGSRGGCARRSATGTVFGCGWAPRTVAEQLDDAKTGEQFGAVLMNLLAAMDAAMVDEKEDK